MGELRGIEVCVIVFYSFVRTLIYSEKKTHQTECRAVTVWCENECGESFLRWQMDDHLEQTCSKRLTECKYCREEMPTDEIAVSLLASKSSFYY